MNEGEPAPFAGDLFPVEDSIRWALEIESCTERASVAADHQAKLNAIALARVRDLAAADSQADQDKIDLLEARLAEATVWHRSPAFVGAVAAAGAVAVLLLSTVLVEATGEVVQ